MDSTKEAIQHLAKSCSRIGAFIGTSDVYRFLKRVALEMSTSKPSSVFPSRYIEHVAYAVDMIASNGFTSPPSAVASVYLNTRFEFYFRVLSGKLNADGTWITPLAQATMKSALSDNRLCNKQINSVALAYKIMRMNKSLSISKYFTEIDNILYSKPNIASGIRDIGDRIEYARHRVAHGQWGDISAEGAFYGLLTAIIYYNQP